MRNERLRLGVVRLVRCATAAAALTALVVVACGCQGSSRQVMTIEAADYERAFATVRDVMRREGMPASFADPRAGVIETQPRIAGSILEPWRTDNGSLEVAWENTVAMQRRRARFEFAPIGFRSQEGGGQAEGDRGQGHDTDLLAIDDPLPDLTATDQPLELRAWVYVERYEVPGQRRSTWTREKTTRTRIADDAHPDADESRWSVVSEDGDYAADLLEKVDDELRRRTADAAVAGGAATKSR